MTIFNDFLTKTMEDYEQHGKDVALEIWFQQALTRMDPWLSPEKAEEITKEVFKGIQSYDSQDTSGKSVEAKLKDDMGLSDNQILEINNKSESLSNLVVEDIEAFKQHKQP